MFLLHLDATSQVANLSKLMEHFRTLFCGLGNLSFSLTMETEDVVEEVDEDVESVESSGALSMMIVATRLFRFPENVTAVSAAPT